MSETSEKFFVTYLRKKHARTWNFTIGRYSFWSDITVFVILITDGLCELHEPHAKHDHVNTDSVSLPEVSIFLLEDVKHKIKHNKIVKLNIYIYVYISKCIPLFYMKEYCNRYTLCWLFSSTLLQCINTGAGWLIKPPSNTTTPD